MKTKCLVIGIVMGFAFAACSPSVKVVEPVETPTAELSAIDSLMWRQPDSALACLLACRDAMLASPDMSDDDPMETHAMRLYNGHYYQLLLAELLYKNYQPQTNRKELLQAVAYFDSLTFTLDDHHHASWYHCGRAPQSSSRNDNIVFLDARAHYINGAGFYEQGEVVNACVEYLKALEVMEDRFEEKELVGEKAKFMAYTYTRLTDLFSDLYLHEQSVYFGKKALEYYKKHDATLWHTAWTLNQIGSHYDMMKQSDSATYYYQKAMDVLNDTATLMYRDIAAHLICLKYKEGACQADSAVRLFQQLLSSCESIRESQARYQNIGEIFYHEHRYDSAWLYLNKVFHTTSVVGLKRQAAEWLAEIGKAKGMDVHAYTDFLVPFVNQEENKSEIKSQLTELYKAFGQAQQERQHQEELRRHHNQSIAVVAGLSFVILIVLSLYYNNKRHKQHLESRINEENHAHNIEKKALSSRLKKSNETLRELQDQIKQQSKESSSKGETQAASFAEEPICRLIMERVNEGQFKSQMDCAVYKDYALGKEQVTALREAADRHFNQFTSRIAKAYPDLTRGDLDYCCLYLLGLSDADVAALMQRAYNTVSQRARKMKAIFGREEPLLVTLRGFASV